LIRTLEDNGYRTEGYAREVQLDYCAEEPEKGLTELQFAVAKDWYLSITPGAN
jgi:effector-binding domain-containing protein